MSISKDQKTKKRDILDLIGGNGLWQIRIFIIIMISAIPNASHNLIMTFYAPNLDHWCSRPIDVNISVETWRNLAMPSDDKFCTLYKDVNISDRGIERNMSRTVQCNSWEYNETSYGATVLSKFDLVCDRNWYVSLSKSIYIAGYLVSVLLFGYLSDRFGRHPAISICHCIATVSGLICAFSTSYTMFAISRFFIAVGVAGGFSTSFVLLMEIVGTEVRALYGLLINLGWCVGYISLPFIVWMLKDWFWIQLTISVPCFMLLVLTCYLPESPRWLLSNGKIDEATKTLEKAQSVNGSKTKDFDLKLKEIASYSQYQTTQSSSGNVLMLIRVPSLLPKSLNVFFLWFVNCFVYYGLSYNTNELAGDPFINFGVSGAIEIPAYIFSPFIIKALGRRNPLCCTLMLGGLSCLLVYFAPDDPWWLRGVIISMLGKFCITCSFSILYVFTVEIFPTVVRNIALGISSVCGRMGSILAPFVRELGKATDPLIPQVIFGILAVTGGILVLFLPETNNKSVPDTFEEAAELSRSSNGNVKTEQLELADFNGKNSTDL